MNSEQIDKLLEKYWNCETTLQEEKELREFFAYGDLPEQFRKYAPLFSYINERQTVTLSDQFNERLQKALEANEKEPYITIRIFRPLLQVAVSVLLLIGMGISVYFITRQDNRPHFVETFEDPNAAIKPATLALEKLSNALKKSEKASFETIQMIDDLKIDWPPVDSLANNQPDTTDLLQ